MKTITGSILLFLFALSALCQTDQTNALVNPDQFLFPQFLQGRIGMKAGRDMNMILNYNVVTEKIVFMQKGKIYDLIDNQNIDSIFVGGKIFLPLEGHFFELAESGKYTLLFQHMGTIHDAPRPAAYGGTSEVSSSTYINNLRIGSQIYRLENEPGLIIKRNIVCWLRSNGSMESFGNEKQLLKLIPDKKDQVKRFIRENHLKFDNTLHMIKVVNYCNSI